MINTNGIPGQANPKWNKPKGREPLPVQHASLSSQRAKCRYGRPLSTWPTETFMTRSFMIGHDQGTSANMLRTVGSQGASIHHGATRIKSLS